MTVGGDWTSSTKAAGAYTDNLTEYQKLTVSDDDALLSKITSLVIKGQAIGVGGIAAQEIGSVKVGGTRIELQAGPHNDNSVPVNGDGLIVDEAAV